MSTELQKVSCLAAKVEKMEKKLNFTTVDEGVLTSYKERLANFKGTDDTTTERT